MVLREVLHAHIPTLNCLSNVRDAVDRMDVYQFAALVIVDENMKPVAVITEGDICRAAHHHGGIMRLADQPAIDFASKQPTTVGPDAEVSDALHTMLMSGLTVLPVIESERLMGMVLRMDLMQAMLLDSGVEA